MHIQPRLGGGKLGDPSVYIDIVDRKRGLMFDCGMNNFSHASLRKVTDLFVSHTHIDHFIGFDTLLRLNIAEAKALHVYGPPGITQNVMGKLQGYTWNICQSLQLTIVVHEVLPDRITLTEMQSHLGYQITRTEHAPLTAILLDAGEFSVGYFPMNHKTASFGYAFIETDSFNVQKEVLHALGLEPGPWLATLKQRADAPEVHQEPIQIDGQTYTSGALIQRLLVRKPGIKITYLTDFRFEEATLAQLTQFAVHSDVLFCEAAFAERDREKAHRTYHLTAKEAGTIARLAEVRQLVLFHFSKRYQDYSTLLQEARAEFPNVE